MMIYYCLLCLIPVLLVFNVVSIMLVSSGMLVALFTFHVKFLNCLLHHFDDGALMESLKSWHFTHVFQMVSHEVKANTA